MEIKEFAHAFLAILNGMSPYILLGFLVAGILHAFVRPSAMSRHLGHRGIGSVIKAALFGIPLPLCSCGVLPAAVSLYRRGASKGATTSFLIATPQTGVDSIAATYSLLGLPMAILRPLAALVGAVAGGYAVDRSDRNTTDEPTAVSLPDDELPHGFAARAIAALRYGFIDMVASVGKWLVIGLVVAALITIFVPDSFFTSLSQYPLLAMIAVVIVAIPMYICATGSIPIALSLMLKGLSPGIAFVMLMAGPAANFASIILLSRTYGRRTTAIYVGSVVVTAILFGLAIDMLLPASWFIAPAQAATTDCHHAPALFDTICSALLVALLIYASIARRGHTHTHNNEINTIMKKTYTIKGMACPHCSANVEKTLRALDGVEDVNVNLGDGTAEVIGEATSEAVCEAIRLAGYECEP